MSNYAIFHFSKVTGKDYVTPNNKVVCCPEDSLRTSFIGLSGEELLLKIKEAVSKLNDKHGGGYSYEEI